jgi:hypothetical protein
VLRGVVELSWSQIVAMSVFLLALGALLRWGFSRSTTEAPDEPLASRTQADG